MRKWILVPVMIIILSLLSSPSSAIYNGIPLKESQLFNQIALNSGTYLKDIVILPKKNSFDMNEAIYIIQRLDQLPSSILKKAKKRQIKIVLFTGNLTDNESIAYLKGKTPRGYPENTVWDEVPGIGGSDIVYVKIGSSMKGMGHGSVNLEYHEFAHSLFHIVYNDKKTTKAFTSIWKEEARNLYPNRNYLYDYKEEYFAESFAYFFYSNETRDILRKAAPKTYAFFNELQ